MKHFKKIQMKKIIAFSFLLISFTVYGQDDRRKKDSIALFAPTEKGVPDGETISEKIGNNGGRLISSDKKSGDHNSRRYIAIGDHDQYTTVIAI